MSKFNLKQRVIDRIKDTRDLMEAGKCAGEIKPPLVAGVDLGTSNIQVIVVDSRGNPVAAFFEWDNAVRDGIVVDYAGACSQLRGLKKQINSVLGEGYEVSRAAVGYPPGTEPWVETNVVKECGFEIVAEVDEPTAAAVALDLNDGALVDIGGGTTGISVLKDGEVVYTADEATGGHHLSLVIAGRNKISFEEAEEQKISGPFSAYMDVVRPVIEKMGSIVRNELRSFPEIKSVYLVGGTSIPDGFENIFAEELERAVHKPPDPILITPLGIALQGLETVRDK